MNHASRSAALGLLLWALGSSQAWAEPAAFRSAPLSVLEASRFVNEPPGTAFRSDELLSFTRRRPFTNNAGAAPVSVRIFSLPTTGSVPTPWAVFEPCWVYFSTLLPVQVNASGTLHLFTLSADWLRAERGDTLKPARYLLVFEQGAGDGHGLFRLNEGDRADYFRHGLLVEVQPARSFSRAEADRMADAAEAAAVTLRAAARANDAKLNCYVARVQVAVAGDDGLPQALALVDGCDPASLTP